jgi:hypothetical protein
MGSGLWVWIGFGLPDSGFGLRVLGVLAFLPWSLCRHFGGFRCSVHSALGAVVGIRGAMGAGDAACRVGCHPHYGGRCMPHFGCCGDLGQAAGAVGTSHPSTQWECVVPALVVLVLGLGVGRDGVQCRVGVAAHGALAPCARRCCVGCAAGWEPRATEARHQRSTLVA